jgi:hypothetical protein
MRSGLVEADLTKLVELVPEAPPYVVDLVVDKREAEHGGLDDATAARLAGDVPRLHAALDEAANEHRPAG